jgi:hypothetical protein
LGVNVWLDRSDPLSEVLMAVELDMPVYMDHPC